MTVTIQAVLGAIRTIDGIKKSHLYKNTKGVTHSNIRSAGIYAKKNYAGQIIVSFWTGGSDFYAAQKDAELTKAIQGLTSKGFVAEKLSGDNAFVIKGAN